MERKAKFLVNSRYKKHFSIEEARAAIPVLRRHFTAVHRQRDRLQQADKAVAVELERTGGDLGGTKVAALLGAYQALQHGLLRISRMGVVIKDIDRGLVDFPHLRDGEEVFLCWELEEDDIEFWHDIESGYAGRERL